jgi:hypothetical protein
MVRRNTAGRAIENVAVKITRDGMTMKTAAMDFGPNQTRTLGLETAGNANKTYRFVATVDPDDRIRETDETNNTKTLTVRIGAAKKKAVEPVEEKEEVRLINGFCRDGGAWFCSLTVFPVVRIGLVPPAAPDMFRPSAGKALSTSVAPWPWRPPSSSPRSCSC